MSTETQTTTRVRHVRTPANYTFGELDTDTETNVGPSETIPDQALSLQDLIRRHTQGLEVPTYQGTYSDEEFPDLQKMDISERYDLAKQNGDYIQQLQAQMRKNSVATKTADAPKTEAE